MVQLHFMIESREECVREREKRGGWGGCGSKGKEGVVREAVRGEIKACGPSRFSIPGTSRDKLNRKVTEIL